MDCAYDEGAMLALDYAGFDSTLGAGWRTVGDKPGCEHAGAELLAKYATQNKAKLNGGMRRSLRWHEAQLRAAAGETDLAIILFDSARPADDAERNLYADATIALLLHDRAKLAAVRAQYAALPATPNLPAIDAFLRCWDRPYREAKASP